MTKKYVKVNFKLADSKKRSVTVKNIQSDCTDENLKALGSFIDNFIEGTKGDTVKIVETTLE